MMITGTIKNRAVPDGRGIVKAVPYQPPARNGSVMYDCLGFKVQILGHKGCWMGAVQTEDGTPFFVKHANGDCFKHRQSARTTVRTVIRWHKKFGTWRIPRDARLSAK